ncbi:hypothetical protein QZH41_014162 [Actinostola sp. cb2023]|nr:hypothetical protein QZH41_014162 [Actinostola sp. cb2023]
MNNKEHVSKEVPAQDSIQSTDKTRTHVPGNTTKEFNLVCQPFVPAAASCNKEEQREDIDDIFIKLALQKGIKVGNLVPSNNKTDNPTKLGKSVDEFERLALRNGIRIGASHLPLPKQDSKSKKGDCYDDLFEKFAIKNGIKIGSDKHHPDLSNVSYELEDPSLHVPTTGPNCLYYDTVIPYDVHTYSSQTEQVDWCDDQSKNVLSNKESTPRTFEELARKHGIKIGMTRKADAQCQTLRCSVDSQETQTFDLIKLKSTSVQVDVDVEAFKREFHSWMQQELNLLDSTAASFRELYCDEVDARTEAERRLVVAMDENVKSQRNTKMLIDELKEQLKSKENIIEKLSKELKSLKKHKDNEIKRLTKEIKQKEEDTAAIKHESQLKDVAIEGINEISRDQTERIEELEDRLREVEKAMENEEEN